MNAISMLEEQHEKVTDLFQQYEEAQTSAQKKAAFEELADDLAVHTTIEEQIFYPAVYASDTEGTLAEAVKEHLSVKRLLVDLMDSNPEEKGFDAKMSRMRKQVEHHVQEEREQLFPRVREVMPQEILEELGARMQRLFALEMDAGPSRHIGEQLDEAAQVP